VLQPGNVVTIEPGIYIPDWGGVRIEDDVVIGKGGCTVINKAPKELIEL
jgi:Xaa-Pro aminopeptidase